MSLHRWTPPPRHADWCAWRRQDPPERPDRDARTANVPRGCLAGSTCAAGRSVSRGTGGCQRPGRAREPRRPLTTNLTEYLRRRQLLLVLDNCEHLIEAAATLADELLRACPQLHMLTTSREPLAIDGEVTHRVPSLAVPGRSPAGGGPSIVEAVNQFEAVASVVERAQAAASSFARSLSRTPPTLAQIWRAA